jgi:hypothetical protein
VAAGNGNRLHIERGEKKWKERDSEKENERKERGGVKKGKNS